MPSRHLVPRHRAIPMARRSSIQKARSRTPQLCKKSSKTKTVLQHTRFALRFEKVDFSPNSFGWIGRRRGWARSGGQRTFELGGTAPPPPLPPEEYHLSPVSALRRRRYCRPCSWRRRGVGWVVCRKVARMGARGRTAHLRTRNRASTSASPGGVSPV